MKHISLFIKLGVVALVAWLPTTTSAIELINTEDMKADIGFRINMLGQVTNVTSYNSNTNVPKPAGYTGQRDLNRIYFLQEESRLKMTGEADGMKFYFEQLLGGETVLESNNLLEAVASVPVTESIDLLVGQWKSPTYRGSAVYSESRLLAHRSWLSNLFFNQGYDNGLALNYEGNGFGLLLGTMTLTTNLPARYLPEVFKGPPLFARISIGNLEEDVLRQTQAVRVEETQWGLHFNGQYANDSKAGHTTLLSRSSGLVTGGSSPGLIGNATLSTMYNPFLGKTETNNGPADAYYATVNVDGVLRKPLGDLTLIVEGGFSWITYHNEYMKLAYNPGEVLQSGDLTTAGGELLVGVMGEKWAFAGQGAVVIPDVGMGRNAGGSQLSYFDAGKDKDNNIYEITFPAITYMHNSHLKVIAQLTYWLNSPEVNGDSGVYEVIEVPSQPGSATDVTFLNPIRRAEFVSQAQLMAQIVF